MSTSENLQHLSEKAPFSLYVLIALSCLLHVLFIAYPKLLIEEAYYWNYALHLDMGYIDHPPMIALLIKASTFFFGNNEAGVRFSSLLCWGITFFYGFRLSESISKGSGIYACLLIAILPFSFIFSFIITPDSLLMALWSALLYYLYKALHQENKRAWYSAGLILGLGLLSKYSILLLAGATFIYMLTVPKARHYFFCKEPYLAIVLSLLLFSPVIYWNATHEWISFTFQTTRRIQEHSHSNIPNFILFLIVFFTPIGLSGFANLWKKQEAISLVSSESQYFMRVFTTFPLVVFGLFSINHTIKFDWIGPTVLATIPWLAAIMQTKKSIWYRWKITGISLLLVYTVLLLSITFKIPSFENLSLLKHYGDWEQFTHKVTQIAQQHDSAKNLTIVSLDKYGTASELVFYQNKYPTAYPLASAKIFGYSSLMFDLWTKADELNNKTIMLISLDPYRIEALVTEKKLKAITDILPIWPYEAQSRQKSAYYYQMVKLL